MNLQHLIAPSINAMSIISIAASAHMIAKGEFAAAFQVKGWWPIFKKSIWVFVTAALILNGFSYLIAFVGQFLVLTFSWRVCIRS